MPPRVVCDDCGERFLEVHDAFGGEVTVRIAKRFVADAQVTAYPGAVASQRCVFGW